LFGTFLAVSVLLASLNANAFGKDSQCSDVGGAILTNVGGFGLVNGHLSTLGVATGDLKGAIGVEIQTINTTSTVFGVQHHWVTDSGETLNIDFAQATGTFVLPGLLAITDYRIHLSGGTGRFADATGNMTAIGELDLNNGHAILRYSGQVCHNSDHKGD
jgi:hypothetical protein